MKTAQQIQASIDEKNAHVDAIIALGEEEKRELNAEEIGVINAWHGEGKEPGEYGAIVAKLEQAQKIEARKKQIATERMAPAIEDLADSAGSKLDQDGRKAFAVPRSQRRHGSLKAFRGQDAEKDAYISGRHFAASLFGHEESKTWLDEHSISAAMSTGDNSKGGLFVPVETESAIIRLVEDFGVFRQYASPESMASNTKVVPVRTSGMTAYPVAETKDTNQSSNTGTESDPGYRNIELVARKWKTLTRTSDELNEDSLISMADQIAMETALAFATAEDGAGFVGDGTSTYHGIKGLSNSLLAGSVYTALTGNTSFSSLDMADFLGMLGDLPDYPGMSSAWHISKEGYYASMARLQLAAGGNTVTDFGRGPELSFLGLPVVFNQKTNKTLSAQTDTRLLYLGDLGMSAKFGNRRGVTMSLSEERYWDVDQIGIKGTERFDINIHSTGTATEAGAIIGLDTPSS